MRKNFSLFLVSLFVTIHLGTNEAISPEKQEEQPSRIKQMLGTCELIAKAHIRTARPDEMRTGGRAVRLIAYTNKF